MTGVAEIIFQTRYNEPMKIYSCDDCGATFRIDDDDFDDVCPECFSENTVYLTDEDY